MESKVMAPPVLAEQLPTLPIAVVFANTSVPPNTHPLSSGDMPPPVVAMLQKSPEGHTLASARELSRPPGRMPTNSSRLELSKTPVGPYVSSE